MTTVVLLGLASADLLSTLILPSINHPRYSELRVGACGAGWIETVAAADIESCYEHCRADLACGYFSISGDDCALYTEDAGCPATDQRPSFTTYKVNMDAVHTTPDYAYTVSSECADNWEHIDTPQDCVDAARALGRAPLVLNADQAEITLCEDTADWCEIHKANGACEMWEWLPKCSKTCGVCSDEAVNYKGTCGDAALEGPLGSPGRIINGPENGIRTAEQCMELACKPFAWCVAASWISIDGVHDSCVAWSSCDLGDLNQLPEVFQGQIPDPVTLVRPVDVRGEGEECQQVSTCHCQLNNDGFLELTSQDAPCGPSGCFCKHNVLTLRIESSTPALHLRQVVAYREDGSVVEPETAVLSSQQEDFRASNCITDADETCRSADADAAPWLKVFYPLGAEIVRIEVVNSEPERVVSADIGLWLPGETQALWLGSFGQAQETYEWDLTARKQLRDLMWNLPQKEDGKCFINVELPVDLTNCIWLQNQKSDSQRWVERNADVLTCEQHAQSFQDQIYENCLEPKGLSADATYPAQLRDDVWAIGDFIQPEVPLTDGLDTIEHSESQCMDGDLMTACNAGNGDMVLELEAPVMLMRVVFGSAHFYSSEPFEVEAFDGVRWNYCAKIVVWRGSQWSSVYCVDTLYATKIRVSKMTRIVSEVYVQGLEASDAPTEIEVSDCVHQDSEWACLQMEGCAWDQRECTGYHGPEWDRYENHRACGGEPLETVSCKDGEATWFAQLFGAVSHRDVCHNHELAMEYCRTKVGPHCWGYTVQEGYKVQFLGADASDTYECDGLRGLEQASGYNTYKRPYIRFVDITIVKGSCFEYRMASGILRKGADCSEDMVKIADGLKFQMDGVRDCGMRYGYESLESRTCFMRRAFRQTMGPELYDVFEALKEDAFKCRKQTRRLDTLADKEFLMAMESKMEERRRAPSKCTKRAQMKKSFQCNSLRARLALKARINEQEDAITNLENGILRTEKNIGIATTVLDASSTALGTTGAGIDGYYATNPASWDGWHNPENDLPSGSRRRVAGAAMAGGAAAMRPAIRRRGPVLATIMVVSGIISLASTITAGVGNTVVQTEQQKVNAVKARIGGIQAEISSFANDAALAKACQTTTTEEVSCMVEDLGVKIDQMNADMKERFENLAGMMNANHAQQVKALNRMNTLIAEQSNSLWNIEQAIYRVESQLNRREKKDTLHSQALEVVQALKVNREMLLDEDKALLFKQFHSEGWCIYLNQSGGRHAIAHLKKWLVSDSFLEDAKPTIVAAKEEAGRGFTACERDQWALKYAEDFKSVKALFEFAAWMRMYYTDFDDNILQVLEGHREDIDEAFLTQLAKITSMDVSEQVRCETDEIECPVGYHAGDSMIVTRMPCEPNQCVCPEQTGGQPIVSPLCVEHFKTVGCVGNPKTGYHEEPQDSGLVHFELDRPYCALGVPPTTDKEVAGFHEKHRCASCNEGAYLSEGICKYNTCQCTTGHAQNGAFATDCDSKRNTETPNPLEPQLDYCMSCDQNGQKINLKRYFTLVSGSQQAGDAFRSAGAGVTMWSAVLTLPRSLSGTPQLEAFVRPDECDRSTNGCESSDKITIEIATKGREQKSVTYYNEPSLSYSSFITLPDSDSAEDEVLILITASSASSQVDLHPALNLYFHVPGDEPLEYLNPEDKLPTRVCSVWVTKHGIMDTIGGHDVSMLRSMGTGHGSQLRKIGNGGKVFAQPAPPTSEPAGPANPELSTGAQLGIQVGGSIVGAIITGIIGGMLG